MGSLILSIKEIRQLPSSASFTSHDDVQPLKDRLTYVEECSSCVFQTTGDGKTSSSTNLNCFGPNFFIVHNCPQSGYRSCSKVHWSWCCHRRCCWIWCWYRNSFRKFDHRLCKKSNSETPAVFICHSWIRFVRSYGTFLAYDGILDPLWIVDCHY